MFVDSSATHVLNNLPGQPNQFYRSLGNFFHTTLKFFMACPDLGFAPFLVQTLQHPSPILLATSSHNSFLTSPSFTSFVSQQLFNIPHSYRVLGSSYMSPIHSMQPLQPIPGPYDNSCGYHGYVQPHT